MEIARDDVLTLALPYRESLRVRRTVYDAVTVKTPHAGLVSGLRQQSILFEGDLLARIQTREEVTQEVDTYLFGHGQ